MLLPPFLHSLKLFLAVEKWHYISWQKFENEIFKEEILQRRNSSKNKFNSQISTSPPFKFLPPLTRFSSHLSSPMIKSFTPPPVNDHPFPQLDHLAWEVVITEDHVVIIIVITSLSWDRIFPFSKGSHHPRRPSRLHCHHLLGTICSFSSRRWSGRWRCLSTS